MCHLKLVDNLRNMGFRPYQADFDLWLRPWLDHYECIAVVIDDLLIFTNNPAGILEPLRKVFWCELKLFETPEYYNGGDVGYEKEKGKFFKKQIISSKTLLRKLRN